jgi:anaerobic selenocysteine-containing dehydrogenase
MCGLTLTVEDGRVTSVRGDDDDPLSRGFMCPKGPALAALHEDPDRLRQPQRRTKDGFVTIGWDEALDEAADRLHAVQQAHGRDAVAVYAGNPIVHNVGAMLYGPSLLRTLGTRRRYSATSVDQLPQMMAAFFMYGHQMLMPIPDIDRTRHMVVLGGNPVVSNGSIMSAPDVKRRLRAIRDRGGKVVVIDPRRTETAAVADEHVFVRPGSDAALLAAMVHVLLAEDLVSPDAGSEWVRNLGLLRDAVAAFSPAAAAAPTGIDEATIRRITRELAAADRGVLYGRVGVSMHAFGGLCHWLVNVINALIGGLDRPGGAMFTRPAYDIVGGPRALGVGRGSYGRWFSNVRGLPEFGGELPAATLAEDIEAGGDSPIRALVTIAGNPVLSTPNGPRLEAALSRLDFRLAIDFFRGETAQHADLILPPTGPLEHDHFDVAFHALAVRNTVKYSPAVFEADATQRHDHQIIAGLERRLLARRGAPRWARAAVALRERLGPAGILELGLRAGPWGFGAGLREGLRGISMAKLRAAPHGIDLGPLQPCLPARLPSRHGGVGAHVDLAPEVFMADLRDRTAQILAPPDTGQLVLIGRRQLRSNNSWLHNVPKLMTGRPRCTVLIHPDDAARLGITDGGQMSLESRVGRVTAPAQLDANMMPGVVSLPHGFGHDRPGTGQRLAALHAGASINDLTDDQRIDPLSGVAAFSGLPVRAAPA